LTPLPSADTIRSVRNEASTYDHRWLSVSVTCLALAGTHMTVLAPFRSSRLQLPASLPSGRFCSPPLSNAGDRLAAVPRHRGNMKALTPAAVTPAGGSLRLRRLAVPTFRPQPHDGPHRTLSQSPQRQWSIQGFATDLQARRSTPPKRVRHPTDCRFVSGCSPPRLAATRLPSTSEL
jgi:hypothetical protein